MHPFNKNQPQEQPKPDEVKPDEVKPREPRITAPSDVITEPNPAGKKGRVIAAGISPQGGSFDALAKEMDCTTSNVRQHVAQAINNFGYGAEILGDNFKLIGKPTNTWESQVKIKAEVAKQAEEKKAQAEATKKALAESKEAKEVN